MLLNAIFNLLVKYFIFYVVKQRYTENKSGLPKGSSYLSLWQRLAHRVKVQTVSSAAEKFLLVDTSASLWQLVKLRADIIQALDSIEAVWTHFVQGHLFPHLGRSFLGKGFRVWRVHEVQKTDQCSAFRFESDSESLFYFVVVTDHRLAYVCGFPSPIGFDGHFHACQDNNIIILAQTPEHRVRPRTFF